jgi:hypothetical protein
MPRRQMAREIEARVATCGSLEGARASLVDDLAAKRWRSEGIWLVGTLGLGVGFKYAATRQPAKYAWNFWALVRDGEIDGYRVEFPDNKTVTAGPLGLTEIDVWSADEEHTAPAPPVQQTAPRRRRGGPPAKFDWHEFYREIITIAHLDGLPERDDLTQHMRDFVAGWSEVPGDSTLREKMAEIYERLARGR